MPASSTPSVPTPPPAPRLTVDPRVAAREGRLLEGHWSADSLQRLQESMADVARMAGQPVPEAPGESPGVAWTAWFEIREHATDERRQRQDIWLHLCAQTQVLLVCQRCLSPYPQPLEVDRWFRFVKDEATADAEDDAAEEDLLVLDPRFDVTALVEDELLLALPLIPAHTECPQPLLRGTGHGDTGDNPSAQDVSPAGAARPHPFAALETWRKK